MKHLEPDSVNAKALYDQAKDRLKASRVLIESGFPGDSIGRSYYAAFAAVSLLFYTEREVFTKHATLIGEFNRKFVHPGLLNRSIGLHLNDLFRQRQRCDYTTEYSPDRKAAELALEKAAEIVDEVDRYVRAQHPDLLK